MIFQNHPLTGLLFLFAVFFASPIVGVCSLIGTILNTLLAYRVRPGSDSLKQGLYGYDGMLVGAMIGTFYTKSPFWIVGLIIAPPVALLMKIFTENFFEKIKLPQLTFPFVITSWLMFLLVPPLSESGSFTLLDLYTHSFSQIFLVGNTLSAIMIIIGLLFSSRRATVWATVAPLVSLLVCAGLKTEVFGFSTILTAVALGDIFRKDLSPLKILMALFVTTLIQVGLNSYFIALTAPFIMTTWLFLYLSGPKRP